MWIRFSKVYEAILSIKNINFEKVGKTRVVSLKITKLSCYITYYDFDLESTYFFALEIIEQLKRCNISYKWSGKTSSAIEIF